MNKFFGFFKEKLVEANVQNKKELESLVSVLGGDDTAYKSEMILSHLQKIKSNYMTWSILIANQASTGLYYSQIHNHNVCLKKANSQQEIQTTVDKYTIIHNQMQKTHQQLKEIGQLSENWVKNMSQQIQEIKNLRIKKLQQNKIRNQALERQNIETPVQNTVEKIAEKTNKQKGQTQKQISPIILSEIISSPVLEFTQQQNENQILSCMQKW